MRPLLYFNIILLLAATNSLAQFEKKFYMELHAIAQTSFETYKSLISEENYKEMGFESSKEIYSATIDTPIVDFFIRLDQLRKYNPGDKADELLIPTEQLIYPVLANGQVRSSITLSKTDGKWQAVSYGSPTFIATVTKTLKENMKESKLNYSDYFVVRIPSLNFYFLGYRWEGELFLVPLIDDVRLGFKSGASITAKKVLASLLPEAKALDELPR